MGTDLFFLFPSGVAKKYVATTQHRCSDRSGIPVRPVVAGQVGGETNELRPGRTRRGRRTQCFSRVSRPTRPPSIDVETKEEQHIVDEKKLGQNESKKIKVVLI